MGSTLLVGALLFAALAAPPDFRVSTRLDYYTSERTAQVMLAPAGAVPGKLAADISIDGRSLATGVAVAAGATTLADAPIGDLAVGEHVLRCRLLADGREVATAEATLTKLPPHANEVKIDRLSGGLIVDGLPFFPFGFYTYSPVPPGLIETEALNGFTHVSVYSDDALDTKTPDSERVERIRATLDRCAAVGMKAHYQINATGCLPSSPAKWKRIEADVTAFRDHPALLAWYIADEPEGSNVQPAILAETYRFVKKLDPYHPITTVIMSPEPAERYSAGMDVIMVDPYPMPAGPVTKVGDAVAGIAGRFAGRKPTWCVPQAFGGNEWWQREPTPQEERAMTYLSLINDATGIQYFIRSVPGTFPKSPIMWSECGRMALEVAEMTPFLLSGEAHPGVTCSLPSVRVRAWKHGARTLILAVNTENRPQVVRIKVDGAPASGEAQALFEYRRVDVVSSTIEEPISAYGSLAYVLPPGPAEDEKPTGGNLVWNSSFEITPSAGTPEGFYASVSGGANYFVDSRVAYDGSHSLRITCPDSAHTVSLSGYPLELAKAKRYEVSVWAKARTAGVRLDIELGGTHREFTLTTEWQRCAVEATGFKEDRTSMTLHQTSAGVAWIDLLEVREVK